MGDTRGDSTGETEGLQPQGFMETSDPSDPAPQDTAMSGKTHASPGETVTRDAVAAVPGEEGAAAVAFSYNSGGDVQEQSTAADMAAGEDILVPKNHEQSLSTNVVTFGIVEKVLEDERDCLLEMQEILEVACDAERKRYAIEGGLSADTIDTDSIQPYNLCEGSAEEEATAYDISDEGLERPAAVGDKGTPIITKKCGSAETEDDGGGKASRVLSKIEEDLRRSRLPLPPGRDGRLYMQFMPLTDAVVRSAWGTLQSKWVAELEAEMLPEDCRSTRKLREVLTAAAAARPQPRFPPRNGPESLPPCGHSPHSMDVEKANCPVACHAVQSPETAFPPGPQRAVGCDGSNPLQETCERLTPGGVYTPVRSEEAEAVGLPPINSSVYTTRPVFVPQQEGDGVYSSATHNKPLHSSSGNDSASGAGMAALPVIFGADGRPVGAKENGKPSAKPANYPCAMASTAQMAATLPNTKNHLGAVQPKTGKQPTSIVAVNHSSDEAAEHRLTVTDNTRNSIGSTEGTIASSAVSTQIVSALGKNAGQGRIKQTNPRPNRPPSLVVDRVRKLSCSLPLYATAEKGLEEKLGVMERVQDIIEEFYDEYTRSLENSTEPSL
ncbi:hypothetical protein BCY84_21669 [Trypanosoma cruzi cruzi]|nr:hypothetical protein BCY84_21669 [Trypanosoma cruzi cruzi]